METDFLNFHDEEHFGTGLYQSDLLDDSQSSLLDIVGDAYSRQDSREYIDHSVIWEQDVESELNGDMAVIPMSSHIDSFPKLSNSPPSKDFQKIFSDWQHLTAIETSPAEDLTADLHLPAQTLGVDMLDCFTPAPPVPTIPDPTETFIPATAQIVADKPEPVPVVPHFDFSDTAIKVEPSFESEPKFKKKEPITSSVRKAGGKNLELLKQVVKEDIDLDTGFKAEINSSDELDNLSDNFDITSYVNGDDAFLLIEEVQLEPKPCAAKAEPRVYARKLGGCYEKNMPEPELEEAADTAKVKDKIQQEIKADAEKAEKKPCGEETRKSLHEDSEEDCIDVETVSEQMPVLQARDLTSLLEQFEASEAVNPKLPQTLFAEERSPGENSGMDTPTSHSEHPKLSAETKPAAVDSPRQAGEPKPKKPPGPDTRASKHANKNIRDALPLELIQKIKASGAKKPISVIPAMPSKKPRGQLGRKSLSKKVPAVAVPSPASESYHLDHDYCSMSPVRLAAQHASRRNSSDSDNAGAAKKLGPADHGLSDGNVEKAHASESGEVAAAAEEAAKARKTVNLIDDTAIRIGKQIKSAISSEQAALKQKLLLRQDSLLKHQPTVKNADGKLMVSLLKANSRTGLTKLTGSTIVNTTNAHDERVQNIIVSGEVHRHAKKRKLNLEEYKRLRGDLIKAASCESSPGNSGANSPMPVASDKDRLVEEKYQELMMKMASDILKTNAKARPAPCDATLDAFVPPDAPKAKAEDRAEEKVATPPRPVAATDYEMRTIVSIGVNTDESCLQADAKPAGDKVTTHRKKKAPEAEGDASVKLTEIITPILQTASAKIHSNSLITNITATLLQQSPQMAPAPKAEPTGARMDAARAPEAEVEHGEDKTVIILDRNVPKPETRSIAVQTDGEGAEDKPARQYRARRDSSASSTASVVSLRSKGSAAVVRKGSSGRRASHHISSSNSISSSLGSRWSRSRSRSRSSSAYSHSSYSSDSSRSKSRSVSPARRWHTDRNSRSRHRYNRSRRRSRSNGYRGNYKRSRSPYSRSRSRLRRERESAERERIREVEERRVIYVGKIDDDTTKTDLRRRFQGFGPITNVSVHFRDHGDNYGFVTFAYKVDAYEAVERGNDDPNVPKYDISFGGRRAFCKTRYSDLDNIEAEAMTPAPIFRREEDSFDILLREVQAKLRKRKV